MGYAVTLLTFILEIPSSKLGWNTHLSWFSPPLSSSGSPIKFRDKNPLKINRRFGRTCSLHLYNRRISQVIKLHEPATYFMLAYFSAMKMEAICCSET
jgi:hypothetical protein